MIEEYQTLTMKHVCSHNFMFWDTREALLDPTHYWEPPLALLRQESPEIVVHDLPIRKLDVVDTWGDEGSSERFNLVNTGIIRKQDERAVRKT